MFSSAAFGDLMLKQMDPMNGIMQQFATQTIESQDIGISKSKAQAITEVMAQRSQAEENKASATVLEAFDRILKRLSS